MCSTALPCSCSAARRRERGHRRPCCACPRPAPLRCGGRRRSPSTSQEGSTSPMIARSGFKYSIKLAAADVIIWPALAPAQAAPRRTASHGQPPVVAVNAEDVLADATRRYDEFDYDGAIEGLT